MNSLTQTHNKKFFIMALFSVFLVALFGFLAYTTSAHQDSASCNASGLQQFPSIVSPAGSAYDGSIITYSVIYVNSDPDAGGPVASCNVTAANADILLPNGSNIDVLTGATLNVGGSISCPGGAGCALGPYTYAVNHANEVGSSVTATFDIAGVLHQDADEEVASDHDTLSKTVIHPSTRLTKQADDTTVTAGTLVTYTYTEMNDGDVPLTTPSVVDDTCAPVTYVSGDTNTNGILNVGETWTYTCSMIINADTTNTATGRGLDPNGNNVTWCQDPQNPPQGFICDQDERAQATVDVVQGLQISKTAETSYDREWDWTIQKSVDQNDLELAGGESYTVNYDVTVNASSENINETVSGIITVTNPEGNPTATVSGITDDLDVTVANPTVDCSGNPGGFTDFPHQLDAGESLVCTYSGVSDGSDTENTATVTTTGAVPGGSDSADVNWGAPASEIDECADVTDPNELGVLLTDTICVNEPLPHTYEYDLTFGPERRGSRCSSFLW